MEFKHIKKRGYSSEQHFAKAQINECSRSIRGRIDGFTWLEQRVHVVQLSRWACEGHFQNIPICLEHEIYVKEI